MDNACCLAHLRGTIVSVHRLLISLHICLQVIWSLNAFFHMQTFSKSDLQMAVVAWQLLQWTHPSSTHAPPLSPFLSQCTLSINNDSGWRHHILCSVYAWAECSHLHVHVPTMKILTCFILSRYNVHLRNAHNAFSKGTVFKRKCFLLNCLHKTN